MNARSLQLREDPAFERLAWRVQRIGWLLIAMIVLLGGAGFAGSGPLARGSVGAPADALSADYARYTRAGATQLLRVRIGPTGLRTDRIELSVSRDYLDGMRVHNITPAPSTTAVHADAVLYGFAAVGNDREVSLSFQLEPLRAGRHRAQLGLAGGPDIAFEQFAWP